MNIARTICLFRNQYVHKHCARNFRVSSSFFESSQASQPQVKEEKYDFEDLKLVERTERRKAKIEPFMKNVFVSIFDRDLLAFPEILNKEESEALDERCSAIQKVFADKEKTVDDRKETLKRLGMYAAPVGLTKGGLAANVTERLRYLEVISSDMNLAQAISDHWVALEALKVGLTSEQYQQIIDDVTSGDHTISLCIKEKVAERITQADFRTRADLDGQGIWRISGEKICSNTDGYMIVLCAIEADNMRAFLVHPHVEGVTRTDTTVNFLRAPATALELGSEQQLAEVIGRSRLYAATLCRGALTKTLHYCMEYVNSRACSGKPLSEMPTVRSAFGEALLYLYASESAEYFTAGLCDGYEEPDAQMEVAMCRSFMTTHCLSILLKLLAIPALEKKAETAELLDDARELVLRGETLDSVNSFIALNGLHYAGKILAEEVKQIRNPLFHPTFIIKKVLSNRHQERDDPKLTLYLAEHLHPSLRQSSEQLEYCVVRMRYACETLMSRYGSDVTTATTELSRLAEAATEILALTAVLARASRSYCIGLRNAQVEMKLAACFVETTKDRVRRLIREIDDGEYLNLDHFKLEFGRKVLDTKSTVVENPTARVFW